MGLNSLRVRALAEALADAIEAGDVRRVQELVAGEDLSRADRLAVARRLAVVPIHRQKPVLVFSGFDAARISP